MQNTRAIIFDMDMTLINSFDTFAEFLNKLSQKYYKKPIGKDRVRKYWGIPHEEFISKVFGKIDNYKNIKKLIEKEVKAKPLVQPAIESAIDVVSYLKNYKFNLGILTSSPSIDALERLANAGFQPENFDIIICSDNTKYKKPDHRVFDSLNSKINEWGLERENIIYIGDGIVDYIAARDAGIPFIAVTSGFDSKNNFINEGLAKDFILNSLGELKKYIFIEQIT